MGRRTPGSCKGQTTLAVLRQQWPSPYHQLAVNPGCPIATFLTTDNVADLATGRESLVSFEEVGEAVADRTYAEIRRSCLRELSGQEPATDSTDLQDAPPANPLETALNQAISSQDGTAYLRALLEEGPVILLTAEPVADPEQIYDDFPWRVLDRERARAIAVFSSREAVARTGAPDPHLMAGRDATARHRWATLTGCEQTTQGWHSSART